MFRLSATAAAIALVAGSAFASDVDLDAVNAVATQDIKPWLQSAQVLEAVKSQNAAHAAISQDDIATLDKSWRAQVDASNRPLIDGVLANDLSAYLAQIKEQSAGMFTEIFVMDFKGLNVGQSDLTSDYWQGDEAKFTETFGVGPDAMHVSGVEFDESTQTFQVQVSLPVVENGAPIGAITVGLNAEALQ